jgi:predicted RNA-binding protein with PUA-like domain
MSGIAGQGINSSREDYRMAFWLFKQEPSCYSLAHLERDGTTTWDGVTNAAARIHLRNTKKGDKAYFYHTGDEKAVVGVMEIASDPKPDPEDEKGVVLDVKFVKRLKHPVPLAAIKADAAFKDWDLVRISRLSVMPCPPAVWKKIEAMSKGG